MCGIELMSLSSNSFRCVYRYSPLPFSRDTPRVTYSLEICFIDSVRRKSIKRHDSLFPSITTVGFLLGVHSRLRPAASVWFGGNPSTVCSPSVCLLREPVQLVMDFSPAIFFSYNRCWLLVRCSYPRELCQMLLPITNGILYFDLRSACSSNPPLANSTAA